MPILGKIGKKIKTKNMNRTNKFFERLGVAFVVILCVFSSWIFITKGLDLNDAEPNDEGDGAKVVYYFSSSKSTDATDPGNYYYDSGLGEPASELPDFSTDEIHIIADSQVDGDITLAAASTNEGTINGNATFLGDESKNLGTVTGTLTRIYSQSISTSRNFTQDATHWTVIATDGAVVNVTNATYNGSTIFSTQNGGSFVYPVEQTLGAGRFSGIETSKTTIVPTEESQSSVYNLSDGPIASNDEAKEESEGKDVVDVKEESEGKIVQSEAETKNEKSETTSSSPEVVITEEVKEVTVSAPKTEDKLPLVQAETTDQLKSKLLVSVEETTKVWYVAPNDTVRYEVSINNSLNLFRKVSLGITNKDLNQIPVAGSSDPVTPISQRLVGRFLLQVESRGETWYVDQLGYKHRVTSQNLLDVASKAVLGIDNEELEQIPVANTAQ